MQKKIAITGGIGSGKSLAAAYVAEMGYPVFSCDEINRRLWHDDNYVEKIKNLFPQCVQNGKIDKNLLAATVFSNSVDLKKLNEIAHPIIMKRLRDAMEETDAQLVFAEVPLLFEGGYENLFDEIIIIRRGLEERIAAVQKRDNLDEAEIKNRILAQFDYTNIENRIKNLKAHIIENEGDEKNLQHKINQIISQLL